MNDQRSPETPASDLRLEAVYARAIPRLLRIMLVASVVLLAPAFRLYGWAGALGLAAGAAVSYINFLALARGVEGLAERIVDRQSQEKGRKIVLRFLMRYGLVAAVAYAIFKSSALAFRGFLWGLCLPVAAMMIEAGFEAYAAFRRK
jgi:ATP synthase I chain